MASDGLWDNLTNDQAVELVAKWLASRGAGSKKSDTLKESFEPLIDMSQYYLQIKSLAKEGKTALQDDNVAVHLARNALGGGDPELISSIMAFTPPWSRWVRDDITVQVVFFGDGNFAV